MLKVSMNCLEDSLDKLPVAALDRQRALSVLSQLLASPVQHDAAVAYHPYSRLTPTGFPVEFSFGNPADEIRYATEVGGHAVPASDRLELACRRLSMFGAQWDPEQIDWCAGLQAGNFLKYGTWAGVRHSRGTERFKLYVEVPLTSHSAAMRRLPATKSVAEQLTDRGARLIMLGLEPQHEAEFYFGLNGLRYRELPSILGWFGAQDSAETVIEAIELLCGRFLSRASRNRQNGLSVKRAGDGHWHVTLFSQADDLFNSGAQTRRSLLRAAAPLGCDLTSYAVFSSSAAEEFQSNRHCMLAFTPLPDGSVDLRVGSSPPSVVEHPPHTPNPGTCRGKQSAPTLISFLLPIADRRQTMLANRRQRLPPYQSFKKLLSCVEPTIPAVAGPQCELYRAELHKSRLRLPFFC